MWHRGPRPPSPHPWCSDPLRWFAGRSFPSGFCFLFHSDIFQDIQRRVFQADPLRHCRRPPCWSWLRCESFLCHGNNNDDLPPSKRTLCLPRQRHPLCHPYPCNSERPFWDRHPCPDGRSDIRVREKHVWRCGCGKMNPNWWKVFFSLAPPIGVVNLISIFYPCESTKARPLIFHHSTPAARESPNWKVDAILGKPKLVFGNFLAASLMGHWESPW